MPQLRAFVMIGMFALLGVISGCTPGGSAQLKPETFVGEYVFQMGDSGAPHHDPDRLTLKADGRYVLVHMPGGHPGPTQEGTWRLWSNLGQPQVAFGNRTYPVEMRGKRIRLLVNDDLGYWYQKIE
jgi:hypothetical protein